MSRFDQKTTGNTNVVKSAPNGYGVCSVSGIAGPSIKHFDTTAIGCTYVCIYGNKLPNTNPFGCSIATAVPYNKQSHKTSVSNQVLLHRC